MVNFIDFEVGLELFKGSDGLQKFGFEEVKKITEYYCLQNIITEEKIFPIKHWSLFREKISILSKNPIVKTFTDILCRQAEDIKGKLMLLEIMMKFSPSTATCERSFSCMNREKRLFKAPHVRTRLIISCA